MINIARQIKTQLTADRGVIIVCHQNPDGDALGSAAAFYEWLAPLKPTRVFCATPVQPRWYYLPAAEMTTTDRTIFQNKNYDTILVLDSGDPRYAGIEKEVKTRPMTVVNIDHHPTNERFGDINCVNPTMSSTCEIAYNYFRAAEIHLNRRAATALLTGIITDTDSFTNSATTASSLAAAAELIRQGGDMKSVHNCTIRNKSLGSLKLWGMALSRLTRAADGDTVYTHLGTKDWTDTGADEAESEGIANFLNNLDDTKIALILKETADGKIKGSMRSTRADADLATIAKKMGGGGHKKAAGFTAPGTMDEVLSKLLDTIEKK